MFDTSVLSNRYITSETFEIKQNISLADKNWFKTGGLAKYYCQPTTAEQFAQALAYAQTNNLNIFVLGSGANILISDEGFDGLVIHPQLRSIHHQKHNEKTSHVTAGAGTAFHDLINYCLDHKLLGLEEFSGIPGTVGGSVYINLHYYEFLLEQFLVSATIINQTTGKVATVSPSWFNFGYDQSKLQDKEWYLIDATFTLNHSTELETEFAKGRHLEIIRHRTRRFPYSGTCGSFFRNFTPQEVANTEKKLPYVAYYLDKLGIKGELQVGDAKISHQHANMIVNMGNATTSDIITLAKTMQTMVQKTFSIIPQPECQLIGFKNNPL